MVLNARCFTFSILASALASNFVGLSSSNMIGNIKDGYHGKHIEECPSFVTFNLPLLFIAIANVVCVATLNFPVSYIIGKEGYLPLPHTPPPAI